MKYLIVVAAYGWVLVGALEDHTEEGVTFARAAALRRWGDATGDLRGLGREMSGPKPSTQYDLLPGRIFVPRAAVVFTAEATGWECLSRDVELPREARRAAT